MTRGQKVLWFLGVCALVLLIDKLWGIDAALEWSMDFLRGAADTVGNLWNQWFDE